MAASPKLTAGQIQDLTDMLADDYMGLVDVLQPDFPHTFRTALMTSAKKVVQAMSKKGITQEHVAAYLRAADLDSLVRSAGLATQGPAPQEGFWGGVSSGLTTWQRTLLEDGVGAEYYVVCDALHARLLALKHHHAAKYSPVLAVTASRMFNMVQSHSLPHDVVSGALEDAGFNVLAATVFPGVVPAPVPATSITQREADLLAKSMFGEPMASFKNALCLLIQGDPPRDPTQGPLEFKRLSQHGWIIGVDQVCNAIWANKVDRRMVREALSILGYSGVADAVLGHDDAYMLGFNESAQGSSPAGPVTVAVPAGHRAVILPLAGADRVAAEAYLAAQVSQASAAAPAPAPAPAADSPPSLREKLQGLAVGEVEKAENEAEQCCICMDNKRCLALVTCGHMLCVGCTKEMESRGALACPQCRSAVQDVLLLRF